MAISYLFVGDDFTGSSDTLAAIAETGKKVRLFLDTPSPEAITAGSYDAIGIATDLRSLAPPAICARLESLAGFMTATAPRFIHYKVCSTFDSSPGTGNIGAAATALMASQKPYLTAIIGGQPSLKRYCAFGNLFAADLTGEVSRIDRHPVMSVHPSTPMAESDLRRHLDKQGFRDTQLLAWPALEDEQQLAGQLAQLAAQQKPVLLDALNQQHIHTIGRALRALPTEGAPILIIGASSVPEAIFGDADAGRQISTPPARDTTKPCLVIAGSRSASTVAQIAAASQFQTMAIGIADLASTEAIGALATRCASMMQDRGNLIAHLVPAEDYGLQGIELANRLAELTQAIFAAAAIGKLAIAGGDTSSIIIRRLGFDSLDLLQRMAPGVALCSGHSANPALENMTVMLKGGQVGGVTIFDQFAATA